MLLHFYCTQCKGYNDILNEFCVYCSAAAPSLITYRYRALVEIYRGIYEQRGCLELLDNLRELRKELIPLNEKDDNLTPEQKVAQYGNMSAEEQKFARFYSEDRLLVKDMDASQLREHRDILSNIAFEAKARLTATDDELRERKSKDKATKNWLISTENTQTTSDAIAAVRTRTARMSKMDKLRADLRKSNIDEETIDDMIRNLERKATEKGLKTVVFKAPAIENKVVTIQSIKPSEAEEQKPFNASNLKFGSK